MARPRNAQNSVEYGALVALVAILALLIATTFGDMLAAWLQAILRQITAS